MARDSSASDEHLSSRFEELTAEGPIGPAEELTHAGTDDESSEEAEPSFTDAEVKVSTTQTILDAQWSILADVESLRLCWHKQPNQS